MPSLTTSWPGIPLIDRPWNMTSPDTGRSRPEMVRSVVDAAPLDPIKVTISPA